MRRNLGMLVAAGLTGLGAASAPRAEPATSATAAASATPVVVAPAADGTIVLSGSVATIRGTMLRWEPQEKKRTLGFWTKAEDSAEWTFSVQAAGAYDVEILQGCGKGQGGSEMMATLDPDRDDASALPFVVEDTGGFQEFRARTIGRVTLSAGDHVLRIKPQRIANKAACDIRQVRLVPAD